MSEGAASRTGEGRVATELSLEPTQVNGEPAVLVRSGAGIGTVLAMRVEDGRITGLYAVRNPEKLAFLDRGAGLRR